MIKATYPDIYHTFVWLILILSDTQGEALLMCLWSSDYPNLLCCGIDYIYILTLILKVVGTSVVQLSLCQCVIILGVFHDRTSAPSGTPPSPTALPPPSVSRVDFPGPGSRLMKVLLMPATDDLLHHWHIRKEHIECEAISMADFPRWPIKEQHKQSNPWPDDCFLQN